MVKIYTEKGNKIHIKGNNQLSFAFWINKFKSEYALHFDIFWNSFFEYMIQMPFYSNFISESSKFKIK